MSLVWCVDVGLIVLVIGSGILIMLKRMCTCLKRVLLTYLFRG